METNVLALIIGGIAALATVATALFTLMRFWPSFGTEARCAVKCAGVLVMVGVAVGLFLYDHRTDGDGALAMLIAGQLMFWAGALYATAMDL